MNKTPFFSILVPSYNQCQYLGEALDSLINQTNPDWEAIIVNDGSTDQTAELLRNYENKEPRFTVVEQGNQGVGSALNRALSEAKGDWICWLSSDDIFKIDKLEIHQEWINNHLDCNFFFSSYYQLFDVRKKVVDLTRTLELSIPKREWQVIEMLRSNYIAGNTICINRKAWLEVGFFDPSLKYAQDYDMWLRLLQKYPAIFIPYPTYFQRIHEAQGSNQFNDACFYDSAISAIKFINNNRFEDFFPLICLDDSHLSKLAVAKSIEVSSYPKSFMYYIGSHPCLINRIFEWLYQTCYLENTQNMFFIKKNISRILLKNKDNLLFIWWSVAQEYCHQFDSSGRLTYSKILPEHIIQVYYVWLQYLFDFHKKNLFLYLAQNAKNLNIDDFLGLENKSQEVISLVFSKFILVDISSKQQDFLKKYIISKLLRKKNILSAMLIIEKTEFQTYHYSDFFNLLKLQNKLSSFEFLGILLIFYKQSLKRFIRELIIIMHFIKRKIFIRNQDTHNYR